MDFSVPKLKATMRREPCFFPEVLAGKVKLEERSVNKMSPRWQLTEGGVWCPAV